MTDEERWKIKGRTLESLKQTKDTIAALRADIDAHAEKLREAAEALKYFLSDPMGAGPTGMAKPDYVAQFFRDFVPASVEEKLHELARLAARARELEEQIKGF
ncbi:MAG TPA: hypothetical protein VHX11_09000 [Acidobacteriaceae bacterium]|jgi:hypothetical protein|nr:hypothetical protein [Acidobacteriaceae bacterium]